ncbi:MAG: beta-ketoacyl-ACP synthase 3 [Chloroflexi bacterium]|nr:beta-ketoacyl-ACP synthase 3 [Chloroflexota bacterium]
MAKRTAQIIGTGSCLPKRVVTNQQLKAMVGNFAPERALGSLSKKGIAVESLSETEVFDEWIKSVTGIRERRLSLPKGPDVLDTEELGAEAARQAMKAAGIEARELDFVVAASFTPHFTIPNLACSISHLVGAKEIGGFVLNTACSGFLDALGDAYYRIRSGDYDTILVVAVELLSKVIDYDDPTTAIIFADGAGAAVVRAAESGIVSFYSELDYSVDHIILEEKGFLKMGGGPLVQKRAVNAMSKAALACLDKSPYKLQDMDYIIPHQANARIITALAKKLGLPAEKFCVTIDKYANTSGSSVAIALDKAVRGEVEGYRIERGKKLLMTSVGGGYALSAVVMDY